MKKLVLALALTGMVATAFAGTGGEGKKDKKSCEKTEKSCKKEAKSCCKKSGEAKAEVKKEEKKDK